MSREEIEKTDLQLLAKQLRKPEGELGTQIGEAMNVGNSAMNLHTIAVVNPSAKDSILEIGMGNGYFIGNILSIDPSIEYVGFDYSADMVEAAKQMNKSWMDQNRLEIIQGDVSQIPFEENSFNKVFSVNTIYFWEDVKHTLQELKRVLKTNGELILAFRPEQNMRLFPVTEFGFGFYTKTAVEEHLQNNGFEAIESTHIYEPEAEVFGKQVVKECLIIKAKTKVSESSRK